VNILNLKLLIEIYMPNNIETTLKIRKKEKKFKTYGDNLPFLILMMNIVVGDTCCLSW